MADERYLGDVLSIPTGPNPDRARHPNRQVHRGKFEERHGIDVGSTVTIPETRFTGWFSSKEQVEPAREINVESVGRNIVRGTTTTSRKRPSSATPSHIKGTSAQLGD